MKLYTEKGWVNWDYILSLPSAFIMVVGARGTGKTYGIFKKLINEKKPFIYVRRLQSQLDISKSESGNPFRKLNADLGLEVMPRPRSKMCEFRHDAGQDAQSQDQKGPEPLEPNPHGSRRNQGQHHISHDGRCDPSASYMR